MILLNSLIKQIENPFSNSKLINYSTILLYRILNEVYKVGSSINFNSFDEVNTHENKKSKKDLLKLINSLSIGTNLMNFLMNKI